MLIQINILIQDVVWCLILFVTFVTNVFFGVDNSSSVHIDNKKKEILVLGKGPTQGLNDIKITGEAEYSINFSRL